MNITGTDIFRYSLKLHKPILIRNFHLEQRDGFVIRLRGEEEICGIGEIAPLPGLHEIAPEQIIQELKQFIPALTGSEISGSLLQLNGHFETFLGESSLSPVSRCGMEMAVMDLLARERQKNIYQLYDEKIDWRILLNGLLNVGDVHFLQEAENLLANGYETLKIKVGRQPMNREINALRELSRIIGPDVKLRLDANRAWPLARAVSFALSAPAEKIEYIEEPVQNPEELDKFFEETGIPVALDETLVHSNMMIENPPFGTAAVILKPSVLGGIEKSVQLIRRLKELQVYPVFSSPYESGISLSVWTQLAAVFARKDTAMGLDTWQWLDEDLLDIPFQSHNGALNVLEISEKSRSINWKRLDLIFSSGK